MNNLNTFLTTIGVSLTLSSVVLLAILQPLKRALALLCKSGEAMPFWQSFTILMLYAVPLFFAVLWTPFDASTVVIVRTALVGSLFGMIGGLSVIGVKVAGARPA